MGVMENNVAYLPALCNSATLSSMNEKQRQKLDKDGKVLLGNTTLGEITGDLMNMGIDPFKVTLEVTDDGPVLVNTEHKDRPVWRNSKDEVL